jgi:hypothetical protein
MKRIFLVGVLASLLPFAVYAEQPTAFTREVQPVELEQRRGKLGS